MEADMADRINVNDPGLITLVNKLQDVFTTVGVSPHLPPVLGQERMRDTSKLTTASRCKTPSTSPR